MTIIFAQPRHFYQSYEDLRSLIALSGFDCIYIDEIPSEGVKDQVFILTPLNGEWEHGIQTDGRVIWWDLEWRLGNEGYFREPFPSIPGVSEVWTSDRWYSLQTQTRYVPLGSHADLAKWNTDGEDYTPVSDAALLGYIVPRRQRIVQELLQRGVKLSATSAWGARRHLILSQTKAYLHTHQWDNIPTIAPLRMVVAAAYSLPVLTETVADVGIFGDCILQADYPYYADCVTAWIHANGQLAEMGARLHDRLCVEYPFRKCIEDAL